MTAPYGVHRWNFAPDGLFTRRQLRDLGLRPNAQEPAGEIRWRRGSRVAFLYKIELAAPVRPMTPAKQAALDAAMRARRTCPECGVEQDHCIKGAELRWMQHAASDAHADDLQVVEGIGAVRVPLGSGLTCTE